jgi:peptidoglycan/LPS O-acetylase OafA/YrhL
MADRPKPAAERFQSLDGMRGILSLLVALFVQHGVWDDGSPSELFSIGGPLTIDLLACVALAALTVLSLSISKHIEMPVRKWFQDLARKQDKRTVRLPSTPIPVSADR